jgi:hypothetical protein
MALTKIKTNKNSLQGRTGIMAKYRIIFILLLCFTVNGGTANLTPKFPQWKRGMTKEQYNKEVDRARKDARRQYYKMAEERMRFMQKEAWKRLLRINEQQYKILEPKIYKVTDLYQAIQSGAYYGGTDIDSFYWHRNSEYFARHERDPNDMIESAKIADELIDLLENKNSKDDDIRKKIDELQQAREKARKELHQVGKEIAPLLTTPRQEAIFLIMGHID